MSSNTDTEAIDSHVHIWTSDFVRYPLDSAFSRGDLAIPRFLPEDILSHTQPHGVGRILLIQMNYYGTDNSLLLDTIRLDPGRFRGLAVVDEDDEDLASAMRRLRTAGVRGFRVIALDPVIKLAERPGLLNMLAQAGEDQLAIGFLTAPEILPELDQVCARFPDTAIVIDHVARIGMNGPIAPGQVDSLCRLARHTKTFVKLSAFYALGNKKPPHDELAPLIRRLYDAFGPSRLMWGSDAPFQTMSGSYGDSIDFIRNRLPFLSDHDKNWILRDTAAGLFFS
jgi:predicted TIM-barrel fold metal-dependent hydrolase